MKGEIIYFQLLKPITVNETFPNKRVTTISVGKRFKHFNGLVSGVNGINFTNKEYFKPIFSRK